MAITAKIWLSIGIFILGFVSSILLGQIQGLSIERDLRTASAVLFPAAQLSQEAEAAFQRSVKAFGDAVVTQDASQVNHASQEGERVAGGLKSIASIPGLSHANAMESAKLASTVDRFVADAQTIYGSVLANPASMTEETQRQMGDLAVRTNALKVSLHAMKEQLSKDLRERLGEIQARSAQQRLASLAAFAITLVIASIIVNLTIRRAITGPILRVIDGVKQAADGAASESGRMKQCGHLVEHDAKEQAACIEYTSASLEEISGATRENAERAVQADTLMREAWQTVERATAVMGQLTASMDVIAKSSKQVSDVLKSIDDIAFHTNILALNAAVEAARAGQAGAGFSIVADEVRALARRTADAARNSSHTIGTTVNDIANVLKLVTVTHGAFLEVSAKIAGGSKAVTEIALSSEEQARGVTQIGQTISRIGQVTQRNVNNAQQTAEAAEAMNAQIQATRNSLDELVAVVGLRTDL